MSCPDCFKGAVHEGTPVGKVTKAHGLDVYVSEPPNGGEVKAVIVIVPDAFGWTFVNNRLLADHYAAKGPFRVYLPEFMNGHAAPLSLLQTLAKFETSGALGKMFYVPSIMYNFVPFAYRNRLSVTLPVVKSFLAQLRASPEEGKLPVGVAGFCWGGKHAVLLANAEEHNLPNPAGAGAATGSSSSKKTIPYMDAGFTGHPSMLAVPADVEKMTLPVAFAIGERDRMLSAELIGQIRAVVEKKKKEGPEAAAAAARAEVRVYPECGHGFCVRAEPGDVEKQALEAEDQCIAWFTKHFKL